MSKSERLSQRDIRSAFHLVAEVCELGEDPLVWRTHVSQRLCFMVGASAAFADEEFVGAEPALSATLGYIQVGMAPQGRAGFEAYNAAGGFNIHPMFPVIHPIACRPWTRTRRQIVADDRAWYGHHVVAEYQRAGDMDDTIHSRQPIPRAGWSNMIAVFRGWGRPPFRVRERRLVHLVHEEIARFWKRTPHADPAAALPPRQQQVVRLLRTGHSEKQAALQLGLSPQTVHAYVKALHRRFEVSSRHELLEQLAPPRDRLRPRLSFEMPA